jgi:hypothetical protein
MILDSLNLPWCSAQDWVNLRIEDQVPPATKRPTPEELKLKLSKKGAATTAATTIKRKGGRGLRESALHTQIGATEHY